MTDITLLSLMNSWVFVLWLTLAILLIFPMVYAGMRSKSSFKIPMMILGGILCFAWPIILPIGFVWGIVAGIKENRADTQKAKDAAAVRAAIFAQYPMFKDEDD